jgi:hypothetical protein
LVDGRPFCDERERVPRQRAGDQIAGEVDRRCLACVAGVEVRRACAPSFQYIQIEIP